MMQATSGVSGPYLPTDLDSAAVGQADVEDGHIPGRVGGIRGQGVGPPSPLRPPPRASIGLEQPPDPRCARSRGRPEEEYAARSRPSLTCLSHQEIPVAPMARDASVPYHRIDDPDQLQALLDAVLLIESDIELPAVLRHIVEVACTLVDAESYGAIGRDRRGGNRPLGVRHGWIRCSDHQDVIGELPEGAGILGLLILDPTPIRLAGPCPSTLTRPVFLRAIHPCARFSVFRSRSATVSSATLYLTEKKGADEFSEADKELTMALASAAGGIAVENARLHARVQRLTLAADRRERIARDLHDTVIQRLFATGLALQSSLPMVENPELRDRLEAAITRP